MKPMSSTFVAGVLALAAATAQAAVQTEEVTYSANGTSMKGYLAYDDAIDGKRPGVLVVHEWWGHNDYVRRRAEMLAEEGYTALALDMYGDGKTAAHPKEAGEFSGAVRQNWEAGQKRFQAALELLRRHPTVQADDVAAIGYCFGGGVVLQMAREGADLDGVVSFHGSLGPIAEPAARGEVTADVLVLHGGDDQFVKPEQVQAFEQEMEQAGVDYEVVVYDGAKHSFTNPQADEYGARFELPLGYDAQADEQSWQRMLEFFDRIFGE